MLETIEEKSSTTSVSEESRSLTNEEAREYILSNVTFPATLERSSQKQVVRPIIEGSVYRINFLTSVQPEGCMCRHWEFTNQGRPGDSIMIKLVAAPNNEWKLVRMD